MTIYLFWGLWSTPSFLLYDSQEEYASYGPIDGSGIQTFFDDWFEFIKVPANIFRRVCKISSIGFFLNPRWPPRLTNIIQMVITP